MPSSKRTELKSLIDDIDDNTLDEIFKILSRQIVNDAVEQMLDGTDSPAAARAKLRNEIYSSSKVKLDDFTDFAKKLQDGKFDKKIESVLLKQGSTPFAAFRKIHPFVDSMFDELVATSAGMGSGVRKAGAGEYLFMLFGANKPKVGDVRWKGKDIEIKGDGADVSPGAHAGYPAGIQTYRHIFPKLSTDDAPWPNKGFSSSGISKFIQQYGHTKWLEFMDRFGAAFFPTSNAQRNFKAMMAKFQKKFSKSDFDKEYGKLVLKCMFEDEKLDAITLVSIKQQMIVTIVDPNKIPSDFRYSVNMYLVVK